MSLIGRILGKKAVPHELKSELRWETEKLGRLNTELRKVIDSGTVVIEVRRPNPASK